MMFAALGSLGGLDRWGAALGWAVFSFLWQGLLIGLFCAAALRLIPRSSPGGRYAVAGGGLALSVLVFCATAVLSGPNPTGSGAMSELLAEAGYLEADLGSALTAVGATPTAVDASLRWIPAVAALWALGALWMMLRLVLACGAAHRLRVRSRIAVDDRWQAVADRLCVDLGIRRRVRVFATELADSPLVVGWLRPVVLVPTATFLVLSAEQLKSVLAHELAHIRRFDPLFNALQAIVEVLLFFHPATWWLSSVIRQEREHCCDLAAVRTTGGPLPLARALTRLESHRQSSSEMVLAASPKTGFLMTRIQRILDVRSAGQPKRASLRPLTLLGTVAIALGLGIASAAANPQPSPATSTTLSLEGRDAHGDYAIVEARILEAVEAHTLSASDAKNVLKALRKSMFQGKEEAPRRVRLMSPVIGMDQSVKGQRTQSRDRYDAALEQVYRLELELQNSKNSEELKRAEMAEKRAVLEERIKDYQERVNRSDADFRRRDPSMPRVGELFDPAVDPRRNIVVDIKEAVRSGEITGEEAKRKVEAVLRKREADRRTVEMDRARLEELSEVVRGRRNTARELVVTGTEARGGRRPVAVGTEARGGRQPVAVGTEARRGRPPVAVGKEVRKGRNVVPNDQDDQAKRLNERLHMLEMELERVRSEASRAKREITRRKVPGRPVMGQDVEPKKEGGDKKSQRRGGSKGKDVSKGAEVKEYYRGRK